MRAEYNAWERSKNIPHHIIMNTLLEKILTDESAREAEQTEVLAVAQEPFESWA
jgi:hypothetical protein